MNACAVSFGVSSPPGWPRATALTASGILMARSWSGDPSRGRGSESRMVRIPSIF